MVEKSQTHQETIKEDTFLSWMSEVKGKFWTDEDKMPKAVADALRDYFHFRRNFSPDDSRALKASQALQDVTGYSAEEFYNFRENLNKGK